MDQATKQKRLTQRASILALLQAHQGGEAVRSDALNKISFRYSAHIGELRHGEHRYNIVQNKVLRAGTLTFWELLPGEWQGLKNPRDKVKALTSPGKLIHLFNEVRNPLLYAGPSQNDAMAQARKQLDRLERHILIDLGWGK